jgi:hypothetical protein
MEILYSFKTRNNIIDYYINRNPTEPKPAMPKKSYPRDTTPEERQRIIAKQKNGGLSATYHVLLGDGPKTLLGKCDFMHGIFSMCIFCGFNVCVEEGCFAEAKFGGYKSRCPKHRNIPSTEDQDNGDALPDLIDDDQLETQDDDADPIDDDDQLETQNDDAQGNANLIDDDDQNNGDAQPGTEDDHEDDEIRVWISATDTSNDDAKLVDKQDDAVDDDDESLILAPSGCTPITPSSPSSHAVDKRRRVFVAPTFWTDDALYQERDLDWVRYFLSASQTTDVAEFPRHKYDLNIVGPPFTPLNVECFRNQNAPLLQFFVTSIKLAYVRNEERADKWTEDTINRFIENGASDQEIMDYVAGLTESNGLFSIVMHGASKDGADFICKNGFVSNRSFSNTLWIPLAHAEPDGDGFHNIIIAILLAGKRVAADSDDFDSGGDMDGRSGWIYTVYREHQAFPLYWVRFQK